MAANWTEMDELGEAALAEIADVITEEPDPRFLESLRRETRGTLARSAKRLSWFALEMEVGELLVVHDGQLVHLVTNDPRRFEERAGEELGFEPRQQPDPRMERQVRAVLGGRARGSNVAYLAALPPFQREVLRATASIPRGEVRPYGWVARQAGAPRAVRAAGTALGHNPVPFVVPCHRVVRADWHLGEYSAGGPRVKGRILEWEGVHMDRFAALPPGVRFIGDRRAMSFCLPPCTGLLDGPWTDLVFFHTAEEAIREGYEACDACLPV